jgi:hypothetical protein
MTSFIEAIAAANKRGDRLGRKLGGYEIELFLQSATISNIADPENLSRVKVLYGESGDAESDWMPVLNQGKGKLSAQYLNTKAIVGTVSGSTDNPFVIGLFGDTPEGIGGSGPVTVPIIDKSDAANAKDPGAECNKENEGRLYIFTSNVSQDLKICMRRNNRQTGPDNDVWEWKNMTRGLVVEKSTDPKQINDVLVRGQEKPVPDCTQELEGELITFSEDRDFRQATMVCKKDENKDWAWNPVGAVPQYIKTTLPKCTEKIHGMQAVIDDGNNSELSICVRYDKEMKWVKYGSRQVTRFADQPPPISKAEMLAGVTPNQLLKTVAPQLASAAANPFGNSNVLGAALDIGGRLASGMGIPSSITDVAGSLLSGNNISDIALQTGIGLLQSQGGGVTDLIGALGSGSLGDYGNLLSQLGPQAEQLLKEGTLDPSALLQVAGSSGLLAGVSSLAGPAAGAFNALLTSGGQGALDTAVQYGLDLVPGPAGDIFKDMMGGLDLDNAPAMLSNLLNAGSSGGLTAAVSNITQGLNLGGADIGGLVSQLAGGQFGDVAAAFQNFSNLGSLNSIIPGLPSSASALMGLAGLSGPLSLAFPGAGLAIPAVTSLLGGNNPLSSILGGGGVFGALGGLFGGGGSKCPCDPKCRKTEHAVDSDGQRLLDPAGNLTLDNSNVYGPDILNNNKTCLAEGMGLDFTGIAESLIPKNLLDFTSVIKSISRVGDMSSKFESAIKGGAEQADLNIEMVYTLEAIEKSFKMADNNLSIMELIQRLELLGSSDFMNNLIADKDGGLLGKMSTDDIEQSMAIKDLYRMIKQLNSVKDGGSANIAPTPAIVSTLANPSTIPAYFTKSKARSLINLIKNIIEAITTLASLDPTLEAPFPDLETRNTQSKVLNDSLSAKISTSQPTQDSLNYRVKDYSDLFKRSSSINFLTPNQLDSGEFDTLLTQVQNEQERAKRGEGDCS